MYRLLPTVLLLMTAALAGCQEPSRPTMNIDRAVGSSDLDQVKRHLYWKTNVNLADLSGDFPLHVAARNGHVTIARELVTHGADPGVVNRSGKTPLEVALENGKTQVAQMLIEQGVPLNPQDMLFTLARDGNSDRDVFEFLFRRGAKVDRPDAKGETLLHIAISEGHLGTVSRLIGYGAEVNQADANGRLPLDIAQSKDIGPYSTNIVELLIRNGARATTHPPESVPAPTSQSRPRGS